MGNQMKVSGIICEYNPFHNGHKYQIEQTRKAGATHIVAVMSGNFVQRGEPALIDKHIRAEMAVRSGADLVIELPVPFSVAPAELFARGAVSILSSIGITDMLSFGSECGDTELLIRCAEEAEKISDSTELKQLLSQGFSYPFAFHKVIEKNCSPEISDVFKSPNNTLAIEYIKAIRLLKSNIKPFTVTRKNVSHDSMSASESFASASMLRNSIIAGKYTEEYIPPECRKILYDCIQSENIAVPENLSDIIRYKILTATDKEWADTPDASNGIDRRLIASASANRSLEGILNGAKTKCFTMARIRRCLCYLILGIKVSDMNSLPCYARVLGFDSEGAKIMSLMKQNSSIPFSTSLAYLKGINEHTEKMALLDQKASDVFSVAVKNKEYVKNEYVQFVTNSKNS